MPATDPTLEELIQRADEQQLIDDYHLSDGAVTLRVGARVLEMPPGHAKRFLQGLLAGFDRAMKGSSSGKGD